MLYLDKINENKQKGEIIEKIFDTIILCYTKNYNNFIEKNNIKEAEIIFNEYISKLKDQKIKNKFIDKCSDILLKNNEYILAYNKIEMIKEPNDEINNHKIEIISKYIEDSLSKQNYDLKKCIKFCNIMINIKTSNIEIMNKMSKAYSLFIDDYCEKYKKEAINYLKEQIKNINENITKDKDREEQYSILKYKIENKIKSLELFINEEKNNNYIKLINEIFDDRNDYRLNNITKEEEKIIENEIKNENKHIKEKAIKININLVKKGKKLKKETINNLIDNIIQSNEEVQTSNEPDINSYIQEKIISHISSELISEDLMQKGKCNLDEEMKEKITKGLRIL
jgi:hypothetical protein